MITWNNCDKNFIKKVEIDIFRIKSIVEKAFQRKKVIDNLKESEENDSFIVEGYYEVIKELLVAYLLRNGLRSRNHQCLIAYFYAQNPSLEGEAKFIEQLLYYRNRLDYYGESIPTDFYKRNKQEISKIIDMLKEMVKID